MAQAHQRGGTQHVAWSFNGSSRPTVIASSMAPRAAPYTDMSTPLRSTEHLLAGNRSDTWTIVATSSETAIVRAVHQRRQPVKRGARAGTAAAGRAGYERRPGHVRQVGDSRA